jgi:hypothetical protein
VRNLRLHLDGTDANVSDRTRVLPTLGPGESQTLNFSVTPTADRGRLEATLRYTTASGSTRTATDSVALRPDELREDVRLDASIVGSGSSPAVAVDVSNLGNAPLESVVFEASRNGSVIVQRPLAEVPSDTTQTAQVNLSGVSAGPLDVRVRYETGGTDGDVTTTVQYTANPGEVELTGIDYEMEEDALRITGSASNVGLAQVDSVVVRVVPTDTVTPVRPNQEYFVGSIPASDFASFDLSAQLEANATTVPIEVTYLADGDRQTRRTEVDVRDLRAEESDGGGGGLPNLPLLVGGLLAALVVVGLGTYAYLRR